MGIQCALCHSTVDNSFAPGIGKQLDGWANRDLNVGAIVSLAPNLKPFTDLLGVDVATSCEPTRLRCVLDEPKLAKLVHEQTHARPNGADHLRERLLAYLRYDGLRLTILPEIHHQEENSSQTFFARIGGPILIRQSFQRQPTLSWPIASCSFAILPSSVLAWRPVSKIPATASRSSFFQA
jgi:hypothetical protein